jgi:hypothetical protein
MLSTLGNDPTHHHQLVNITVKFRLSMKVLLLTLLRRNLQDCHALEDIRQQHSQIRIPHKIVQLNKISSVYLIRIINICLKKSGCHRCTKSDIPNDGNAKNSESNSGNAVIETEKEVSEF